MQRQIFFQKKFTKDSYKFPETVFTNTFRFFLKSYRSYF